MNMAYTSSSEQRRAERKRANFTAVVTDTIREHAIGHLGNLSTTGVLLICNEAPLREAIYQVRFPLQGFGPQPVPIELGVQAQWHAPAASPGQVWAGYRIIAISQDDADILDRWLDLPL